jgi:hypothetical protein
VPFAFHPRLLGICDAPSVHKATLEVHACGPVSYSRPATSLVRKLPFMICDGVGVLHKLQNTARAQLPCIRHPLEQCGTAAGWVAMLPRLPPLQASRMSQSGIKTSIPCDIAITSGVHHLLMPLQMPKLDVISCRYRQTCVA